MQAAMDDKDRIKEVIEGSDMLFITAGMGGGTGTGAAPIVAEIARELGILTVAVVTKPFFFEGSKRMNIAEAGIKALEEHVDSLIIIPNEKLVPVLGKETTLLDAFKAANDILLGAVQGIAELITRQGLINVDFADVKTVMSEMGMAMMGSASAKGQDRARQAAESAVSSPLLEDIDLSNVKGILVNVTAGFDLSIGEFEEVGITIKEFASEDATVVVGTVIEPEMNDELRVTVVATGIGEGGASLEEDNSIRLVYKHAKEARVKEEESPAISAREESAASANSPQPAVTKPIEEPEQKDFEYLDIPAFLRRQAD
jgi:cell division protein FtsZ